MQAPSNGIWGTDISYKWALFSSLPLVGEVVACKNQPDLHCLACGDKSIRGQEAIEYNSIRGRQASLISKQTTLNLSAYTDPDTARAQLPSHVGAIHQEQNHAFVFVNQRLLARKRMIIHTTTGFISHLSTFVIFSIILILGRQFGNYPIRLCCVITCPLLVVPALGMLSHALYFIFASWERRRLIKGAIEEFQPMIDNKKLTIAQVPREVQPYLVATSKD